jgi:type VI protein secretion system component VasF
MICDPHWTSTGEPSAAHMMEQARTCRTMAAKRLANQAYSTPTAEQKAAHVAHTMQGAGRARVRRTAGDYIVIALGVLAVVAWLTVFSVVVF